MSKKEQDHFQTTAFDVLTETMYWITCKIQLEKKCLFIFSYLQLSIPYFQKKVQEAVMSQYANALSPQETETIRLIGDSVPFLRNTGLENSIKFCVTGIIRFKVSEMFRANLYHVDQSRVRAEGGNQKGGKIFQSIRIR